MKHLLSGATTGATTGDTTWVVTSRRVQLVDLNYINIPLIFHKGDVTINDCYIIALNLYEKP